MDPCIWCGGNMTFVPSPDDVQPGKWVCLHCPTHNARQKQPYDAQAEAQRNAAFNEIQILNRRAADAHEEDMQDLDESDWVWCVPDIIGAVEAAKVYDQLVRKHHPLITEIERRHGAA